MADTASSILTAWSSFYVMTGSSAAALTGLMFVVITLVTRTERAEDTHAGIATFSTPTVMHFAAALLISAVLIAPWRSLVHAGVAVALIGLLGLVYILRVMHRTRRLSFYTADFEDWIWYTILPFVAYGAISAGAIALAAAPVLALFILAGGVVLLIFVGIRNAWDIVTYITVVRR
ncbi:MAG TPA: hypothetical protein VFP86_03900 [bacterium]|nr:hypothetical protein [bacterium]